jgi:endonuclease/exonuclease/phosphatase (EEP) superfamily protein YafD
MGFRIGVRRWLPHSSGSPFRVVTLNADGGETLAPQIPILLATWNPDVVALQECGPALAGAIQSAEGWYHHNVRELCLLSRYPIRDASTMDRTGLERVHEDEVAAIGGSGDVVRYTIQTPNGPINFTNLHLETPRKGLEELLGAFNLQRLELNTELRDIESRLARRWVDQSHAPLLIAGDFNTPIESRIFQEHWGDFTDAFSRAGVGLGMTKYNGWIRVRIDHVLTGSAWRAEHVEVGPDLGSDHRPVIVDLTLLDNAATRRRTTHTPDHSNSRHSGQP